MGYKEKGEIKVTFQDGEELTFTAEGAMPGLASDEVVMKEDVDSTMSDISENPVQNKVISQNKANLVNGKVPSDELPSYVDDVVEYASESAFPATGESGKIYVALDTNICYRWSGSEYVQVNAKDNVLNYQDVASFPASGELNIIYIADDTNKQYRWDGSAYIELSVEDEVEVVDYSTTPLTQTQFNKALKGKLIIRSVVVYCTLKSINNNGSVITLTFENVATSSTTGTSVPNALSHGIVRITIASDTLTMSKVSFTLKAVEDYSTNFFAPYETMSDQGTRLVREQNLTYTQDMISSWYTGSRTYAVGDYCYYQNILYRCIVPVTAAESFDSNKWVQTNLCSEIKVMTVSEVESILKYGVVVSSTLAQNSWATIRKVCEMGDAGDFWSVGDTKTDVGTDGTTRTFRICDMAGLYGKHVVFEQVELEVDDYQWNVSTNIDGSGARNNYSISDMKTTHLPAILLKYSSELQGAVTDTTVKVATNGNDGTLVDVTSKLFLPAEKEISTSRLSSQTEEFSALQTFQYYQTHTANSDRIKYRDSSAERWWERSPSSGDYYHVCRLGSNGYLSNDSVVDSRGVSPFFSF